MGIKVTNANSENLVYDNVFASEIIISQTWPAKATDAANYSVLIRYSVYAIDANDNIHVSKETYDPIIVNDLTQRAATELAAGDATLATLMADITGLVSTFITEFTALSTTPT